MARHAKLSASGASRWINCPPSLKMEEGAVNKDTVYTKEGTVAHELAEVEIRHKAGLISDENYAQRHELVTREPEYCQEMQDYIDTYSDWVVETYNSIRKSCPDAALFTEQKLDYSRWAKGGFGTGDVVIIADQRMVVIDLKYGKGVPVKAEDNPQLMLYGLGAYEMFQLAYDIKEVELLINQPRLDSISIAEYTIEDLLEWAEFTVRPAAELALAGEGELKAGDHCRFCKAFPICRLQAEEATRAAALDFAEPKTLSTEEVEDFLSIADRMKKWFDAVQAYALDRALDGHKWENFKLVEGRSVRKYQDELQVAQALIDAGYDEALLYERKLLTITSMEKTVGKKMVKELLEDEGLIIKPQGKPTLVSRSDKRKELTGAEDFE